jgi:hypothetical protein
MVIEIFSCHMRSWLKEPSRRKIIEEVMVKIDCLSGQKSFCCGLSHWPHMVGQTHPEAWLTLVKFFYVVTLLRHHAFRPGGPAKCLQRYLSPSAQDRSHHSFL